MQKTLLVVVVVVVVGGVAVAVVVVAVVVVVAADKTLLFCLSLSTAEPVSAILGSCRSVFCCKHR